MRNRSLNFSLPRLMILILATLDNTVLSATMHNGSHHRVSRKIHLPKAVDTSRKFPCREPQSRAYNLRDLMQGLYEKPGDTANQPVYIVLKRCDSHAGCCTNPDMSCTPVKSATYYEEMEIEIWSIVTNETRRQWIKVEQHGMCTCEITTINDRFQLESKHPSVFLI